MPKRKYFTSEQIILKLREAEVLLSQGKSVEEISKALEVSKQTYYRWRKEYGGKLKMNLYNILGTGTIYD